MDAELDVKTAKQEMHAARDRAFAAVGRRRSPRVAAAAAAAAAGAR